MTDVLDGILDDLRVGLARRAARRRRARAAGATALTSIALAAVAVGSIGVVAETAPSPSSSPSVASRLIVSDDCQDLACWPGAAELNVPKQQAIAAP